MSRLDPALEDLVGRLEWSARATPARAEELIIGDYARGFFLLRLENELQVAQRPLRGAPSLKLRTNDAAAAQKYIGFYAARLLRFREQLPDVSAPVDPASIVAPFALASSSLQCALTWGTSWADFGVGNDFAAAQFSHYGRGSVADAIEYVLTPG